MDNLIRTKIAQLDQYAGNLIDTLEDEYSSVPEEPHIQDLLDALNELQAKITEAQEAGGLI